MARDERDNEAVEPTRPAARERAASQAEESTASTESAQSPRVGKKRGPYNVKRVEKHPATYRWPQEVHDVIEEAYNAARAEGRMVSKQDVVAEAVLGYYRRKRRRR